MKFVSVLSWFALALVMGCSSLSKIEVPEDLLAKEKDGLRIHYFYEDATATAKVPDDEVHVLWWSEEADMPDDLESTLLHNVKNETGKQKADALGIRKFPVFVVVNDKEIVLKTGTLSDVVDFFSVEQVESK